MAFYGSGIFYNSGTMYAGPSATLSSKEVPVDLRFYRTSQDGVYVFWWGFQPAYVTSDLVNAGFDLQLDTASPFTVVTVTDPIHLTVSATTGMATGDVIFQVNGGVTFSTTISAVIDSIHLVVVSTVGWVAGPASAITFNSPNSITFTQLTAITFQNGNVRKGFAVPVAARINGVVQTWYARVRTHTTNLISFWSSVLIWTIPESVQQSTAEALMESLPDYHVYGKGDLLKPVDERTSNLWAVENMYGNQFDQVFYATYLTRTNNFLDLAVDEVLYQNFGIMFNFPKPNNMTYVDYRWILMNLYLASLVGSTDEAVILVAQAFTGVAPLIFNIRDLKDFFLNLIQQGTPNSGTGAPVFNSPYTQPGDGVRTQFTFEYPFVAGSVQVFKNGTRLNPGIDFQEDAALPGVIMSTAPLSTDVLVFFYQIGGPKDPRPILFDPSQTTALPGTITYTHGSLDVVGIGTTFLTLDADDILADGNGYYASIATVNSNTSITLQNAWGGPTETVPALRTTYEIPPLVLWDAGTLAFGVEITILNPADFTLDLALIEALITPLTPAMTKVLYQIAL